LRISIHEEETLGKAYDSKLMKRLLGYISPYRHFIIISIFILIFISCLELLLPLLVKNVIDGPISSGNYGSLSTFFALYVAAISGIFLFNYAQTYILNMLGQKAIFDLRMEIFNKLQSLSFSFFDKNPVGRLITRITSDVDALNELFTQGVIAIFSDIFILIGIMLIMLTINWQLALVVFTVIPPLFFLVNRFRTKARAGFREVRLKLARLNAYLQENITGMQIVQLFNREKRNYEKFKEINSEYRNAFLSVIFYIAIFLPLVDLLIAVSLALIIWFGGKRYLSGYITIGALVAFIQYTQIFFRPLRDLSEKYNILQSAMASSERIFNLLDCNEIIPDPSSHPAPYKEIKGKIEFDSVFFAYDEDDYVLKDLSFMIKPGEKVAFVGATGAGKTTISNLILRFYDISKGRILIDDKDIKKYSKEELRKNIAVILQDPFIFRGDILRNLVFQDDSTPMEKVVEVAKYVNAHEFINRLSGKYHAPVKERGANLSLGQKQLLSFARALLYEPKILILDEATSSVDTDTEMLIQDALKKLLSNKTSIIIAHRLSTIKYVDRIIVLHNGKIVEEGTHEDLLKRNGYYTKLYELQYKEQESELQGLKASS